MRGPGPGTGPVAPGCLHMRGPFVRRRRLRSLVWVVQRRADVLRRDVLDHSPAAVWSRTGAVRRRVRERPDRQRELRRLRARMPDRAGVQRRRLRRAVAGPVRPDQSLRRMPERADVRERGLLRSDAGVWSRLLQRLRGLRRRRERQPCVRPAVRGQLAVPRVGELLPHAGRRDDAATTRLRRLRYIRGRGDRVPVRGALGLRRQSGVHPLPRERWHPAPPPGLHAERLRALPAVHGHHGHLPQRLLQLVRRRRQLLLRRRLHQRRHVRRGRWRLVHHLRSHQRLLLRLPARLRAALTPTAPRQTARAPRRDD